MPRGVPRFQDSDWKEWVAVILVGLCAAALLILSN